MTQKKSSERLVRDIKQESNNYLDWITKSVSIH